MKPPQRRQGARSEETFGYQRLDPVRRHDQGCRQWRVGIGIGHVLENQGVGPVVRLGQPLTALQDRVRPRHGRERILAPSRFCILWLPRRKGCDGDDLYVLCGEVQQARSGTPGSQLDSVFRKERTLQGTFTLKKPTNPLPAKDDWPLVLRA